MSHCYFLFLEHGNIAKAQTLLTKATKCQYSHECTSPSFTQKLWAISVAALVSRVPQKAEPEYIGKGQTWSHTKMLLSSSDTNFPVIWLVLCIPDMTKSKDLGNFDPVSGLNMAGDQAGAEQHLYLCISVMNLEICHISWPQKNPTNSDSSSYELVWIAIKKTQHWLCENAIMWQ